MWLVSDDIENNLVVIMEIKPKHLWNSEPETSSNLGLVVSNVSGMQCNEFSNLAIQDFFLP